MNGYPDNRVQRYENGEGVAKSSCLLLSLMIMNQTITPIVPDNRMGHENAFEAPETHQGVPSEPKSARLEHKPVHRYHRYLSVVPSECLVLENEP